MTTHQANTSAPFRPNWASEQNLRLLLEATPAAIVAVNTVGEIIFVNAKMEEMFGYGREELLGQPVEALLPERFHTDHREHRLGYASSPRVRPMGSGIDLIARRKNGSEFPIEAGLSYLTVDGDLLIFALITDISRRKQTEEMLERRVAERTREIDRRQRVSDSLRDIISLLNSNRPLQEVLDLIVLQASQMLEAEATAIYRLQGDQEAISVLANYGLPDNYISNHLPDRELLNTALAVSGGGKSVHLSGADGDRLTTDIGAPGDAGELYGAQLVIPLALKEEIYGGLMFYYREPRPLSPQELELAIMFGEQTKLAMENARLRAQSEQLAVAAERNRIARDLHDSVTQTLFSASLIAEVLPRIWDKDQAESKRRLEELRQLTRGALAEMRTLLLELRPATLVEVDLSELLRQLTEAAVGRARIPIELTIDGAAPIPPDVKIAFYHIAQEALNNVTKHARASHAAVTLHRQSGLLCLCVRDDGRGFELQNVTPHHLGLTIMQERTEAIQARLGIESAPGCGTEITVNWRQPT